MRRLKYQPPFDKDKTFITTHEQPLGDFLALNGGIEEALDSEDESDMKEKRRGMEACVPQQMNDMFSSRVPDSSFLRASYLL